MRFRKALLGVMISIVASCGICAREMSAPETKSGILVLSDFEAMSDLALWSAEKTKLSLSAEHVTSGKHSAKLEFQGPNPWPGIFSSRIPTNWSGYDVLRIDIFNPQEAPVSLVLKVCDQKSKNYANWFDKSFFVPSGKSTVELVLSGLRTNSQKRTIELNALKSFTLYTTKVPDQGRVLYMDNLRLIRQNRPPAVKHFHRFDFGTGDSPVYPGFTQVTPETLYGTGQGFGWDGRGWRRASNRMHPNGLWGDIVACSGDTFKVDLPNGRYEVWTMIEDSGWWGGYQHYDWREIRAEGKAVLREEMDADTFYRDHYFKHLDTEDVPGEDIWEIYIAPRYQPKIFTATVTDGTLELKFEGSNAYAATPSTLIIYPTGQAKACRQWIQKLVQELRKAFGREHMEIPHKVTNPEPKLSAGNRSRKYILFSRDYLADVYPNSRPTADEIKRRNLSICASRGEYEPVTISVWPLTDLSGCKVKATDLVDPKGRRIASDRIDIRYVQYKLRRFGLHGIAASYEVSPRILRPLPSAGVTAASKTPRRFWITVHVPEAAEPGEYSGMLTFSAQGVSASQLPLKLTVLPITLGRLTGRYVGNHFGFQASEWLWYAKTRGARHLACLEAYVKDQMAHGFNIIEWSAWGEKVQQAVLQMLADHGMDKTRYILGYRDWEKRMKTVTKIESWRKAHPDWPEVWYFLFSEITNVEGPGMEVGIQALKNAKKALRQGMGVRYIAGFNSDKCVSMLQHADIVDMNAGMTLGSDLFRKCRNSGATPAIYNCGKDRFTNGLWFFKSGCFMKVEFAYTENNVDPYYALDGRESDNGLTMPSPDGPLPTTDYEHMREGIDDLKYLLRLERLCRQAKDAGHGDAAKRGQRVLQEACQDVLPELKKNEYYQRKYSNYDSAIFLATGPEAQTKVTRWTLAEFDRRRRLCAAEIIHMERLLTRTVSGK